MKLNIKNLRFRMKSLSEALRKSKNKKKKFSKIFENIVMLNVDGRLDLQGILRLIGRDTKCFSAKIYIYLSLPDL